MRRLGTSIRSLYEPDVDPREGARWMVEHARVAAVPGSSFHHHPGGGSQQVRFAFPKRLATLEEAGRRLRTMRRD
mgnify:CR=1 FL=1